uniref:LolA family protein n=1 Tax=Mycobacterium sp. TaxID=1785 RepID=UPI003F9DDE77
MAEPRLAKLASAIVVVALLGGLAIVRPASVFAESVPLPTPAPLPKTGLASAPATTDSIPIPPASIPQAAPTPQAAPAPHAAATPQSPSAPQASSQPSHAPSFFPFSDKGGIFSNQATAFDNKQRALLDRISMYLSSIQTMVGNFVQIGPDGGRTEGTFYLQKPGRVRFEYNPPSPIDIISD